MRNERLDSYGQAACAAPIVNSLLASAQFPDDWFNRFLSNSLSLDDTCPRSTKLDNLRRHRIFLWFLLHNWRSFHGASSEPAVGPRIQRDKYGLVVRSLCYVYGHHHIRQAAQGAIRRHSHSSNGSQYWRQTVVSHSKTVPDAVHAQVDTADESVLDIWSGLCGRRRIWDTFADSSKVESAQAFPVHGCLLGLLQHGHCRRVCSQDLSDRDCARYSDRLCEEQGFVPNSHMSSLLDPINAAILVRLSPKCAGDYLHDDIDRGFSRIIGSTGQWGFLAFSSASIALKLALQELAKHMMIVVRRPVSRRVMVALVSTPTILVDTQVRILLLRQANLNISIAGTIFIAVFEIVVRATKSVMVQRQTREPVQNLQGSRRRSTIVRTLPTLNSPITPVQVIPTRKVMPTGRQTSVSETAAQYKARRDAMERRQKLRVLHAGEIYADMYAEYIAIGCSFIMLFFLRNHPQYEFTILQSDLSGETSSSDVSFREHQLVNLGYLQTCVEVVVDLLACIIEATRGVDFNSFNQNDPFLIFLLGMLTFSNIAISAGLYMH